MTDGPPLLVVAAVAFLRDGEALPAEPVAAAEIEELRWMRLDDERDDLAPLLVDHVLPALRLHV